jgi:menaquinone-dependent protoporphyrinogen oxidase
MSDTVLVAYATRYGSTREVAERVAATLGEAGLDVTLTPVARVQSVDAHSAVVLGSPLYIGQWLKDMKRFLSRHQEGLARLPMALFVLGPTRADEPWDAVRTQLDQQLAKYPRLTPRAVELFGGAYDPANLRFPDTLLGKLPASPLYGLPASDLRDWEAIEVWAASLPALLLPESSR